MGARPKPTYLAPRNATREVLSQADAQALLRGGSWVRVTTTKPLVRSAKKQRDFQQRRRAAGYREFRAWLPAGVYARLMAERKRGETRAALLERLLCLGLTQQAKP